MKKSKHLLAIDVGNTNITLGVFDRTKLLASARAVTARRTADEVESMIESLLHQKGFSMARVSAVAMASVVPGASGAIREAVLRRVSKLVDLNDPRVRALVPVDYRPASSVGADRIANAAAAHALFPKGRTKIIVDFGTATTFDCVSPAGVYLGGVIHPGVELSARSLFEKTAQLPHIEFSAVSAAVGKDTPGSIRSGLYFGIVGAVREILKELDGEIGPAIHVGTGGLAPLVCPAVGGFLAVDVELTLKGIKFLFDKFDRGQVA